IGGFEDLGIPEYAEGVGSGLLNHPTGSVTLVNPTPDASTFAVSSRPPNNRAYRGKLSGKAILPWLPAPRINEVTLCLRPRQAYASNADGSVGAAIPDQYYLEMWVEVEVQTGAHDGKPANKQRMPISVVSHHVGLTFGLTHFDYKLANGAYNLQVDRYLKPDHLRFLDGGASPPAGLTTLPIVSGEYKTIVSPANSHIIIPSSPHYTSNKEVQFHPTTGNNPKVPIDKLHPRAWDPNGANPHHRPPTLSGQISVEIDMRLFLFGSTGTNVNAVYSMVPVWDSQDTAPFAPPAGQADRLRWSFSLDLPAIGDGNKVTRSLEVIDNRLNGNSAAWDVPSATPPTAEQLDENTLGQRNDRLAVFGTYDDSEISMHDFLQKSYEDVHRRSTIGALANVPIGMQRNRPFETLKFQPGGGGNPPDWLLLDLLSPSFRPFTFLHSATGKINPNARVAPWSSGGDYTNDTVARWKPLQALLQGWNRSFNPVSASVTLPASGPSDLVKNILNHRFVGAQYGAPDTYDYIGELCEVEGVADAGADNWEKEALIRNLANLLTTRSNSFTVHGVVQLVKKRPGASNWAEWEPGDIITAQKRFHCGIERHVWPGVDGVPGNGTVQNGTLTKTAKPYGMAAYDSSQPFIGYRPWCFVPVPKPAQGHYPIADAAFPAVDGPDAPNLWPVTGLQYLGANGWGKVPYTATSLEESANPARAWMRYRASDIVYDQ
ncbi:MAG TPA: hypothetical protein VIS74_03330, partial [Chthoniobacterales bacterium]